jgi:hypothetical protein
MKTKNITGMMLMVVIMTLVSCSNLIDSAYVPKQPDITTIYTETFAADLGKFTAKSVLGDQVWAFNSRGYALISGWVDLNGNGKPDNGELFANEDWLISPEIDLTKSTAAHFTFDYVARYFGNTATDATVLVSENYLTTDSLPSSATWNPVVMETIIDPGAWPSPIPTSNQISLTKYAGKKIRVAFRYISNTTKAGTWEMKNFVVTNGEAVNIPANSGKEAAPYTVSDAVKNLSLSKYVKGTVVGYMWPGSFQPYYFTSDTCTQVANVILADSATNIYISKCLLVQLPVGVVRDSLNLKNSKSLLGKQVTVYGLLGTSIYGIPQMSATSYVILPDGNTSGIKPVEPLLSETMSKSFGTFTTQNVLGDQIWGVAYSAATITGYVDTNGDGKADTNKANEDWLISPEVDLTNITTAKLSFDHVIRYCTNPVTDCTIQISDNYVSGAPSTATWTTLTPPITFTNASSWPTIFPTSGQFNLSAYANKKVHIAFKYVSTATKAGTWELKNVLIVK